MAKPETVEDMKDIIEQWAELQDCDSGDEMRYFAGEVFSIIKFMESK